MLSQINHILTASGRLGASSCARAVVEAVDPGKVAVKYKFDTEHVVEVRE